MNRHELDQHIKQLLDMIELHRLGYEKVTAPLWEALYQAYAMRGPDPIIVPHGSVMIQMDKP